MYVQFANLYVLPFTTEVFLWTLEYGWGSIYDGLMVFKCFDVLKDLLGGQIWSQVHHVNGESFFTF